ncbi:restriction endonuclease subunit S [Candidatus Saccharibacteria bacterium]|nr:restriction endonuclease subunit S [Candidatus Saccharibacteria bacterium]
MTPQLRFPQFTDEWQVKKLGDFSSITTGKLDANAMVEGGRYRFYTCAREFYRIDHYAFDTEALLVSGNGANVGYIHYYNGKFNAYQRTYVLNNFEENIGYIKLYLDRYLKKRILQEKFEGNMPYIVLSTLKDMPISTPPLKEQEKIADFLTAVDERIRLGEQKLAKLEQYKRGVMQKIFSQKIRFKDETGNEYPEWKEKRLGEVGKIITGKTPSTTDKSHWTGEVKFVTPTDMDGQKYQETSTRTVSYTGSLMLPEKSIMYTCIASIGKMSMSVGDTITNQQINSFIPSSKICNEFTYYNLLWLTPRIISTQSNNTLPIINKSEFSKFKVFLPSWEEQQKIATLLTTLDDKITAEKSKLTAAKQFKKALLQRMFV